MEIRDFRLEKCNVQDGGTITGLAAVFGEENAYAERIMPGAFGATIAAHVGRRTMPAMLAQHDQHNPIGRWTSLQETAEGLAVEGRISSATAKSREVRQLLAEGVIDGLSIGFIVPAGGAKRENDKRTITAADLFEISIVAVPAAPSARIREVRSFGSPRELEDFLRDGGLSKKDARALLSRGWSGISGESGEPEHDPEEAARVVKLCRDFTTRLKGK